MKLKRAVRKLSIQVFSGTIRVCGFRTVSFAEMAYTAHKDPEQIQEHFEPAEEVERKAQILADWIRNSKHFIAFTGAGVSTSAGIPDFRGPEGVWTLRDQGRFPTKRSTSTLQAIPTPSHMSLVELQNRGDLKYLVSQNTDGLHRKSGILPERISELHGNSNREYCMRCGKEYIRDFRAIASYERSVHDHETGRTCTRCEGPLYDTIINFGESLPREPLQRAYENANKADLCLVLGSSLTVSPANTIPQIVGERGKKLVICNLQKTPYDSIAHLRFFAKTDDVMDRVMQNLGYRIPPFTLHRQVVVELQFMGNNRYKLSTQAVDVDGTPVSLFRSVMFHGGISDQEPHRFTFSGNVSQGMQLKLQLEFMGHYAEPVLELVHTVDLDKPKSLYILRYNPMTGVWVTKKEGDDDGQRWTGEGTHVDVEKVDRPDGQLRARPEAGMNDPNYAANIKE